MSWRSSRRTRTIAGSARLTLGRDGTLYLTTTAGASPMSNQLIALEPKTLKQKASATVTGANFNSSPLVFALKDKEILAATGSGKLYLFDNAALASGPVTTAAVAGSEKFESGALASWEDAQNTRWIAVSSSRGIVTFKVAGDTASSRCSQAGRRATSHRRFRRSSSTACSSPRRAERRPVPAVLYAIDASNGKELWSSLRTITTSARGGLSAGQGNVYVPGADSTLYAFGFAIEK